MQTEIYTTIKQNIKARGYTLKRLASELGMSRMNLYNILQNPRYKILQRIATILGCMIVDLIR